MNRSVVLGTQTELKAGKASETAAPGWTMPEKYVQAGYSATVPTLFGGMLGRLQRLQEELGKK